jgi:hypothetical protein
MSDQVLTVEPTVDPPRLVRYQRTVTEPLELGAAKHRFSLKLVGEGSGVAR